VIVWNNALKVRKGKFGAQIAHAAMASFLSSGGITYTKEHFTFSTKDLDAIDWISGQFTKIVVKVESEEELLALAKKIGELGFPHALIKDAGLTEFGGIPTFTCLGIGPIDSESIDPYTRHLSLM